MPEPNSYNLGASGNADPSGKPKLTFLQSLLNKGKNGATGEATGSPDGNVFTKLFGKTQETPQSTSQTVAPVILPKSVVTPSLSSILGPKPAFSRLALEEAEKKRLKIAKSFLSFAFIIGLGVYGFFYSQLDPNFTWLNFYFGPNIAARFENSNSELQKKQTELNLLRYRMARLWLDEVNSQIDVFQRQETIKSAVSSTKSQRLSADAELQIFGSRIKNTLREVQKIFHQPLETATYSPKPLSDKERENFYESLLKEALAKQKTALTSREKPNDDEIRLIDNVLRLAENKNFRGMIKNKDLAKIPEKDFGEMLTKIREQGTDELASVEKLRKNRLSWGTVIDDIHGVTRKADPYYGQGLFKDIGGFLFSSYQFDSKSGRISLNGLTKSSDSKTFSLIAQLVDSIEKSTQFKDIDFRSFSKNKNEAGDYSSSVNLEFSIQKGSDPRDEIILSQ